MYKVLLMMLLLVVSGCNLTRQSEPQQEQNKIVVQHVNGDKFVLNNDGPPLILPPSDEEKRLIIEQKINYYSYITWIILLLVVAGIYQGYKYFKSKEQKVKEILNMADVDINKIHNFVTELKSITGAESKYNSVKLWVTVGFIGALIYLFYASLQLILWPVTVVASIFLIVRYLEGRDALYAKLEIKKTLIEQMVKDGTITEEESKIINDVK